MRAREFILEKWTEKYKKSINCANPKGFSQRAHCQGRKKTEDVEQDLKELGTTQYKVTEPRDMVNYDFRTKQVTYKVFKFKVGKQVFLIVLTVKDEPIPGAKKKVPTLNVAFGRQDPDGWSHDDIDTNLTGDNQNQFQIYSTVIKAIQKFITKLNPNVAQIIIKGDNERQQVMYDRFFNSRYLEKFFPGWQLNPTTKTLIKNQSQNLQEGLFDPKLAVDLEWAEGDDYIAARGYVTVTDPDGFGGEYGNEQEVELEVEFLDYPHPQRKEYEVQFKVGDSYAITGGGNVNVIFATVIQACKDFVEIYKPDRLFFTADEQSRARMYDTITKRVAKQVGWHVMPFDEIQKDSLYRNKSSNGFVFVIAKGTAPEKWSSDQAPQHGSFMPIWYVYNMDDDQETIALKVRAKRRDDAIRHAMEVEPSFKDVDHMSMWAINTLPKREVTAVKDGGTAQIKESMSGETLKESKSAPLYHFTTWNNLISILSSNQLTSPSGKIYLTRDYTRQFIPHEENLFKQPYGIRIDQELLSRDYGRKLQAGGQDIGWNEKKRQSWLSDPKNAHEIEKVKQTGRGSGSRYDGADPQDIIKGTVTQSRRWESEEHLNVKNLPNVDKYITGIVIGSAPLGSKHFSQEIDPDPLTKLADILINLFSGAKGFDQRNLFLDSATKLNVPIVYERKEFSPEQVKKRIIQLYSQRKKDRETEQGKAQQNFQIITSPAGGGIAIGGSNINAVLKKLSINPKYRDIKIYGYSIGYGPDAEKTMFDKPIPLLQLVKQSTKENFADGRNPQDKGDSKRHGVPTKASVSTLRKVAKQGGRKGQLAHWMANMKSGRTKNKD